MSLPSVLLHDHLDGGLRPATVLELADQVGYQELPVGDAAQLASWFDQSESGSLETYLQSFTHTIAVMQTRDALERVAYEAVLDLHSDGVVYFESRFCPELHVERGLRPMEVVEAVASGMRRGQSETGIEWSLIIDSLRHIHDSFQLANVAVDARALGVVGFDIAGPESGYAPEAHLAAFDRARLGGLRITIHAGEAGGVDGVSHIASALDPCGAERIGHGVEIINDCVIDGGQIVALGKVAARVRDRQIPLEICPASNLATMAIEPEDHPIGLLNRAGFNVTLNTDNRLMSNTSMSREFEFASEHHRFSVDDLAAVTRRSLSAAFCGYETKQRLWESLIAPSYQKAGADVRLEWR